MQNLSNFKPTKSFLVCIDSDGCAMDTMNIKHQKCFGPKFVDIYGFEEYRDSVQTLWEKINLYTKTRGINRFQALVLILQTIYEQNICPLSHEFDVLKKWTEETPALSNSELEKEYEKTKNPQLRTALDWSYEVNKAISSLPDGEYAYKGVKEAISIMSHLADVVVVSSANSEALKNEWQTCRLTEFLGLLAGQEMGTKSYIISELAKIGSYGKNNILMVGDAMGDLSAAEKNGVLFYPILAGKEEWSWELLPAEAFEKFISNTYAGEYQNLCISNFKENLK